MLKVAKEENLATVPTLEYADVSNQYAISTISTPAEKRFELTIKNVICETSVNPTVSSTFPSIDNNVVMKKSKGPGRPPNNVEDMWKELIQLEAHGADKVLLKRKRNNIASVIYRQNRNEAKKKYESDLI